MANPGISSGSAFLENAAKKYLTELTQGSVVLNGGIDKKLNWIPTLQVKVHNNLRLLVEVSETPYPLILRLRRIDLLRVQVPLAVYSACPEEAYLQQQIDAKSLIADGYGLLTVASDGSVQRRATCIPLQQQITKEEFLADIAGLPVSLRKRLAESFDRYNNNAPSGVTDISEIFEGLVLRAGRDAIKKGWLTAGEAKLGISATTLKAMQAKPKFDNASAAIGAAQGYISMYRNLSHHFPKNNKQAAAKYRDCRHGFLEGLKKIAFFYKSMRTLGLSGQL